MNRNIKLSLISASALALLGLVILTGDAGSNREVTETPVTTPETQVVESESFVAATEEMQSIIAVLANSTGVTTWVPEQPSATQDESPYCEAPINTVWYLTWAGEGEGDYDKIAENLENSFANSDFTVAEVSPGVVDVSSETGLRAVVAWDATAKTVNLEIASACYEN